MNMQHILSRCFIVGQGQLCTFYIELEWTVSYKEGFNWSFSDQAHPFLDRVPTTEYGRFCMILPCLTAVGADL